MLKVRAKLPHSPTSLRVSSWCVVLLLIGTVTLPGQTFTDPIHQFVDFNCVDCHNPVDKEGGLNLEEVRLDPSVPDSFARWVLMFDRVATREMPPKKSTPPPADELRAFLAALGEKLTVSESARYREQGRAVQRRLNRYEYENALRDLLQVPWVRLKERLPPDGEAHRFNKIGSALDVSHVQMARYLGAADYALRQAMSEELASLPTSTQRYYARDEPSLVRSFWPRQGSTLTDRHAFPVLDGRAQPDVRAGRAPVTSPETREREAVGKVASTFSDAGGYRWSHFRAPVGGRYKLRFKGYAVWLSGGGVSRWFFNGTGEEKAPVYWLPLWHRPNLDEVWPGRRHEPIGVFGESGGQGRFLGAFDFG